MKLPTPLRFAAIVASALAYSMMAVVILALPTTHPLEDLVKVLAIGLITALFAVMALMEDYTP